MQIVENKISIQELKEMASKMFGSLVLDREERIEFDSMINLRPYTF